MDEEIRKQIRKMIDSSIARAFEFRQRKKGDMPTDTNQLTPQGYVDLSGTRANRPKTPNIGQQYFSTQDNYPWFSDGVSSWFSASGSVVAAL